jgi:hypothetical protein
MGARGPVPNRSSQRRRTNKESTPDKAPAGASAGVEHRTPPPPAKRGWHPVARAWYKALSESGQSAFYEASDWATAVLVAEGMSRDLRPKFVGMGTTIDAEGNLLSEAVFAELPVKGASLAAYLKAMTSLLVTEGDRRRAKLELQRPAKGPADPDVPSLDDFRDRLSG